MDTSPMFQHNQLEMKSLTLQAILSIFPEQMISQGKSSERNFKAVKALPHA